MVRRHCQSIKKIMQSDKVMGQLFLGRNDTGVVLRLDSVFIRLFSTTLPSLLLLE